MRILLLAPIYAIVSWLMMVFLPVSGYIEIFRDAYEGYALNCFWVMLVLWCGGQRRVIEIMAREEKLSCFLCPLVQNCGCGLPVLKWSSASSFFRCLFSILQSEKVRVDTSVHNSSSSPWPR
jgi:hypothetical protein